ADRARDRVQISRVTSERQCGSGRPSCWPEPWPARAAQPHQWSRVGRVRFFRRVALFGLALLVFAACGVVALLWLAFAKLRIVAGSPRLAVVILLASGLLAALAAVIALFTIVRRVGMPLRGIMEAADQVAEGNYLIRVEERGPP